MVGDTRHALASWKCFSGAQQGTSAGDRKGERGREESESEDEDLPFIAKNFKKFLKYRKGNKNGFKKNFLNKPSSSNIECFNCH